MNPLTEGSSQHESVLWQMSPNSREWKVQAPIARTKLGSRRGCKPDGAEASKRAVLPCRLQSCNWRGAPWLTCCVLFHRNLRLHLFLQQILAQYCPCDHMLRCDLLAAQLNTIACSSILDTRDRAGTMPVCTCVCLRLSGHSQGEAKAVKVS